MNALKALGILLIVGGALGLAYRGFSFTKETRIADIGSVHLAVNEREQVSVPAWLGIGAIFVGGALLLANTRRK